MREERKRIVYEVVRRKGRGESIRGISRALRIDPKTVRGMLREAEKRRQHGNETLDIFAPTRTPRPSKLDRHVDFIADLIARYPGIRATRLHEELEKEGFDGGYTIVREYLKKVRPKTEPRVFQIVETGPGEQGQVDWSPYKLSDGTPMYCFSAVLSFSRYQYARFCADMRQPTIFRQLIAAFDKFGGVPRELVFDSMPGIVDRWEFDQPILNIRAVDFAIHYDFEIHIAPRADGAYKGKVERPFRFIEESLLNARTFHTLQQANETMLWWLDNRANCRDHRRTHRKPVEALADEVPLLRPLPARKYDARELAHHVVDSYGYTRFEGNFYRAPTTIGSWVYIRADEDEVAIVAGPARVIARHPRKPRGAGEYVPPPDKKPKRRPIHELIASFEAWGAGAMRYVERIRDKKRYASAELARILELQETYAVEDMLRAIEHATRYSAHGASELERILELTAKPRTVEDRIAEHAREHVRRAMADAPVRQRGLDDYGRLLRAHEEDHDDEEEADTS